jgi:small subunit ribosomal protein S17
MQKNRKKRVGRVISNKMEKTAVVVVETRRQHRLYKRIIKQISKFMVHDENNECQIGDKVQIMEHRPVSKEKRWIVTDIISRKEVVDVPETEVEIIKVKPEVISAKVEEAVAEEPAVESKPEQEAVAEVEAVEQDEEAEEKPKAKPKKTRAKAKTETEAEAETITEPEAEPEAEAKPEAKPKRTRAKAKPEPEAETEAESSESEDQS